MHIWKIVFALSDYANKDKKTKSPIYRCHSVCRAMKAVVPEVEVIDGHYLGLRWRKAGTKRRLIAMLNCNHTWLLLPRGSIVDLYPVGIIPNPLLVVNRGKYKPFGGGLYVKDRSVTKKVMTPAMWKETQIITAYARKVVKAQKEKEPTK